MPHVTSPKGEYLNLLPKSESQEVWKTIQVDLHKSKLLNQKTRETITMISEAMTNKLKESSQNEERITNLEMKIELINEQTQKLLMAQDEAKHRNSVMMEHIKISNAHIQSIQSEKDQELKDFNDLQTKIQLLYRDEKEKHEKYADEMKKLMKKMNEEKTAYKSLEENQKDLLRSLLKVKQEFNQREEKHKIIENQNDFLVCKVNDLEKEISNIKSEELKLLTASQALQQDIEILIPLHKLLQDSRKNDDEADRIDRIIQNREQEKRRIDHTLGKAAEEVQKLKGKYEKLDQQNQELINNKSLTTTAMKNKSDDEELEAVHREFDLLKHEFDLVMQNYNVMLDQQQIRENEKMRLKADLEICSKEKEEINVNAQNKIKEYQYLNMQMKQIKNEYGDLKLQLGMTV